MNFSCVFLLALALSGAMSQAFIGTGNIGYGGVGTMGAVTGVGCGGVGTMGGVTGVGCNAVGPMGYNGMYEGTCGGAYGAGYGAGYETPGFGCRTACTPAAVCDSCQCLKTIVRPSMVERLPYACARRIQSSTCRSTCGMFSGAGYGATAGTMVGGAGSGYGMNGGYLY